MVVRSNVEDKRLITPSSTLTDVLIKRTIPKYDSNAISPKNLKAADIRMYAHMY